MMKARIQLIAEAITAAGLAEDNSRPHSIPCPDASIVAPFLSALGLPVSAQVAESGPVLVLGNNVTGFHWPAPIQPGVAEAP